MNKKINHLAIPSFILFMLYATLSFAASDTFPPSATRPIVSDFLPTPNNIYYCSPSGSNTTGDGSINNPWVDFIGANSNVGPGDVIYLRGGTYPAYPLVNFSRSQNNLTADGTSVLPIVITNYPGEIARWNSTDTTWSLTLGGDYQKLIGTMVGGSYGIQITGGASIHEGNYIQVSNIEFIGGTSNGGDLNPAMLADPLAGFTQTGTIISHNYFHDSAWAISQHRMAALKFFHNRNTIIEYNLFENNDQLYRGCIEFKDDLFDAIVRYNKFINSKAAVSWGVQGDQTEGLDIYNNLSYGTDYFINFQNDHGNDDEINVYNNIALDLVAFIYYLNNDNQTWSEPWNIYNNIIDGSAIEPGWSTNSNDMRNMPDYYNYNLWFSSSDRTAPSGWSWPSNFFTNDVISNDIVTYNSSTYTVTVPDTYSAMTAGRYNDTIGGLTWDGPTNTILTPPPNVSIQSN